jgi:hypothetical protein
MEVPLHPDAVEFDEVECCAMERASVQEVHQPLIREYMARIGEVHPVYRASLLLGIFENVFHLTLVPHTAHCTLYASLAFAEKSVLEQQQGEDIVLDCEHTIQQHRDALKVICVKIGPLQEGSKLIKEDKATDKTKIPPVRLNRKMNLMAGSSSPMPRVTHKVAYRNKSPRFKIKSGCCDNSFEVYYNHPDDLTETSLEIVGVNASVEDWRAIFLLLLGFERQGDVWVDARKVKIMDSK